MSIRSRIEQLARWVRQKPNPDAEALDRAQDVVQFFVECDIVTGWDGEDSPQFPTDARAAIDAISKLWIKYASELQVPNNGTVERRIVGIYHAHRPRPRNIVQEPAEFAGSLVDRLKQGCRH